MMVGVLLAGGASSRMGSPKALRKQGRVSYLANGIRNLWSACGNVVTVLGANGASIQEAVEEEFARLVESGELQDDLARAHGKGADGFEVHFTRNPRWATGMLSSVQVGLRGALAMNPRGIVVMPVDHPSVRPETVAAVAAILEQAIGACRPADRKAFSYAVVPRHRGRRGHPVALSPALADAVSKDKKATDLSDAMRRNARLVGYLDVDDPGVLRNVNRPGE